MGKFLDKREIAEHTKDRSKVRIGKGTASKGEQQNG